MLSYNNLIFYLTKYCNDWILLLVYFWTKWKTYIKRKYVLKLIEIFLVYLTNKAEAKRIFHRYWVLNPQIIYLLTIKFMNFKSVKRSIQLRKQSQFFKFCDLIIYSLKNYVSILWASQNYFRVQYYCLKSSVL